MSEEINKLKQQVDVEEENEELMNMLINHTITHIEKEETVIELMKQIREYREKIYNTKVQLGEYLTQAYEEKNSSVLEKTKKYMESEKNKTCKASLKCFICDEEDSAFRKILSESLAYQRYPMEMLSYYSKINSNALTDDGREFLKNEEFRECILLESCAPSYLIDMPKCELDVIRKINNLNIHFILNYYEKEVKFWEKMSLKKQIDFSQEEQYLE